MKYPADGESPAHYPFRHIARVTIQLTTPLHVGTGREWNESDAGIARDANGLPTIPGSTLAGSLRSLHRELFRNSLARRPLRRKGTDGEWNTNPESTEISLTHDLFGVPQSLKLAGAEYMGTGSRLRFTWAKIHNSEDTPVDGLLQKNSLQDPVLATALKPSLRDHVKINACGVSDGNAKFDELCVQAGHRFTFEVELTSSEHAEISAVRDLVSLLRNPAFRLGGKTRRGFGSIYVKEARFKSFDLRKEAEFRAYASLDSRLNVKRSDWEVEAAASARKIEPGNSSIAQITISDLVPCGFWMIGGGTDERVDADSAPVMDKVIVWQGSTGAETGSVETRYLIPGTALKGPLRHRCIFHLHALAGECVEETDMDQLKATEDLMIPLFGHVNQTRLRRQTSNGDRAGKIWIDDIYLRSPAPGKPGEQEKRLQHHVRIDPFTGGASDTALFTDIPLSRSSTVFPQPTLPHVLISLDQDGVDGRVLEALKLALDDLCEGRLSLGAHGSRGYGFFTGSHNFNPGNAAACIQNPT